MRTCSCSSLFFRVSSCICCSSAAWLRGILLLSDHLLMSEMQGIAGIQATTERHCLQSIYRMLVLLLHIPLRPLQRNIGCSTDLQPQLCQPGRKSLKRWPNKHSSISGARQAWWTHGASCTQTGIPPRWPAATLRCRAIPSLAVVQSKLAPSSGISTQPPACDVYIIH